MEGQDKLEGLPSATDNGRALDLLAMEPASKSIDI